MCGGKNDSEMRKWTENASAAEAYNLIQTGRNWNEM